MSDTEQSQIVEKVRALLRKAESTEFSDEADALVAKAQELIARHALEADVYDDPAATSTLSHIDLEMAGSYTHERSMLWGAVAHANRCRVVSMRKYGSRTVVQITLVGRPADRDLTKLLAASLEQQALRRLPGAEPGDRKGALVRRRRSYLIGFAGEVSRRLTAVTDSVENPAGPSSRSLERMDELDAYVQSLGEMSNYRSKTSIDPDGLQQGSAAANVADLGQARLRRQQRQLGA